jgi:hypothetical protein
MMQKITSWIHGSLFLFGVLLMTMGPQAAKAEDTSIDASDRPGFIRMLVAVSNILITPMAKRCGKDASQVISDSPIKI